MEAGPKFRNIKKGIGFGLAGITAAQLCAAYDFFYTRKEADIQVARIDRVEADVSSLRPLIIEGVSTVRLIAERTNRMERDIDRIRKALEQSEEAAMIKKIEDDEATRQAEEDYDNFIKQQGG